MSSIKVIKEEGLLVLPHISLWCGSKSLSGKDLKVNYPKGLVSPGGKKIFPPSRLSPGNALRSKVKSMLSQIGCKHGRGAWVIGRHKLDEFTAEISAIESQFWSFVRELEANYYPWMDEWLQQMEDEWMSTVKSATLDSEEVVKKYHFGYAVLQLNLADGMTSTLKGLPQQLWEEIGEQARKALNGMDGRSEFGQRVKGYFRNIQVKANNLTFIDGNAGKLAVYISDQLSDLPKTGKLSPRELGSLISTLHALKDPESGAQWAAALNECPDPEEAEPVCSPDDNLESNSEHQLENHGVALTRRLSI